VGRDFLDNLRAGLLLATFRRVGAEAFRPSVDQLVLLVIARALLTIACSALTVDPPLFFNASAFHGFAFAIVLDLAFFWVLARSAGSPERSLAVAAAFFAGGFSYWPVYAAATRIATASPEPAAGWLVLAAAWGTYLWQGAILYRAARLFLPIDAARAASAIALFMLAAYALDIVMPRGPFWWTDWTESDVADEEEAPLDVEAVFRAQPGLLDDVREHLAPQRRGTVDLYFVAFGADATQDVFLREVRYARELFDERFDTERRSVVLVNHRSTVESLPLATKRNLRDVLAAVAERMDVEEDVLFLFLTGHGSREHELAVNLIPWVPLDAIDPAELAEAIAASGIRNRVVVLSACYSGGFVDALRGDTAIVATASATDRRSFGCSNEAHFTYYGEALFAHALRDTLSFPEAFEAARADVSARERKEEKEPSLPQLSIGDALRPRLAELERRLATLAIAAGRGRLEALGSPPEWQDLWPAPEDDAPPAAPPD
jgi:hypothetical protein